jgi:hypothetical protein
LLRKAIRKRIKDQKWEKHSNKNLMFQRIKEQTDSALSDLTIIAEKLPEERLAQIFTEEKLDPFFKALMKIQKGDRERTFLIGYSMLKNSLNPTSSTLGNKWAQKLYDQHEGPLREILDAMYHEKTKLKS